jgi:DNA-directed RNA polymerase II subunit RPB1
MDGAFVEHQKIPLIKDDRHTFESDYRFDGQKELTRNHLKKFVNDVVIEDMTVSPDVIRELELEFKELERTREVLRSIYVNGENEALFPCNLTRLVWNARKQFDCDPRKPSDLHPLHVIQSVRNLIPKLQVYIGDDPISRFAQEKVILAFSSYLKGTLASKKVLVDYRLTKRLFFS